MPCFAAGTTIRRRLFASRLPTAAAQATTTTFPTNWVACSSALVIWSRSPGGWSGIAIRFPGVLRCFAPTIWQRIAHSSPQFENENFTNFTNFWVQEFLRILKQPTNFKLLYFVTRQCIVHFLYKSRRFYSLVTCTNFAEITLTLWRPLLPYGTERQSARMSKITNDGLTRSGTWCFIAVPIWQYWASKG